MAAIFLSDMAAAALALNTGEIDFFVLYLYQEKRKDMNYADKLRAEQADKNKEIIKNLIEPRKDAILEEVSNGIRRIGYVTIDTSGYRAGTYEGCRVGIHEREHLPAFTEWLKEQGFKVKQMWWGMGSCSGYPDMIEIRL